MSLLPARFIPLFFLFYWDRLSRGRKLAIKLTEKESTPEVTSALKSTRLCSRNIPASKPSLINTYVSLNWVPSDHKNKNGCLTPPLSFTVNILFSWLWFSVLWIENHGSFIDSYPLNKLCMYVSIHTFFLFHAADCLSCSGSLGAVAWPSWLQAKGRRRPGLE